MKIASWNVNSLKVRLPQVLDWLAEQRPDILAMQETKLTDENFPADEIRAAGYEVVYAGQKTYNGVAILSRVPGNDTVRDLPGLDDDPQRRLLGATYGDLRVLDVYIPNGQEVGSEKYDYKLDWLEKLRAYVAAQLQQYPRLILLGDYNIAPDDRDVHDPEAWREQILCSTPERAAFKALIETGLHDSFRLFPQEEKVFSWWDYRAAGFRRNAGLRIDHVLVSDALKDRCRASYIDTAPRRLERPSDHAPAVAEFDL
ncbi:MAG: exodeoxyribonuclease III [Pseudomonadota bacterium]